MIRSSLGSLVRKAPMVPVLIIILVVFSIISRGFLSVFSIQSILLDASVLTVAALGGMLVFLVSGIDLSVGATVAGASVTAAIVGQLTHNPGLSLGSALLIGGVIGAINGALIGFAKFVPFIVTLAMLLVVTALAYLAAAAYSGQGATAGSVPMLDSILAFGQGVTFGLPNLFPTVIVAVIVIALVLYFTRFGRQIRLVGQNEDAARFNGLNVPLIKFFVYTLAGVLSGIAGCLLGMRLGAGNPAGGDSLLLQVITAVIIGGTTLLGGHGGAIRTLFGALVIVALTQGLSTIGFQFWDQNIVLGFVILLGTQIGRLWGTSSRTA
ncbi:ABC transporter permease [Glaciihabitans sp. UYNi722]|uniref:ABC transporter permease n=1 Tax=Glaciihabitans sp. UYNi722 TaxID=3156344 RepID=UPI0033976584